MKEMGWYEIDGPEIVLPDDEKMVGRDERDGVIWNRWTGISITGWWKDDSKWKKKMKKNFKVVNILKNKSNWMNLAGEMRLFIYAGQSK